MNLELSITTDYAEDIGDPEPYLKKIAKAGFTHIHWCHERNTDYIYSETEINTIIKHLDKYKLKVLDLHASDGKENNWISTDESIRRKGVELVKNRIYMANKLSCEVIIMHFNRAPKEESEKEKYWDIVHETLDKVIPYAKKHKVKIALENYSNEESKEISYLFSKYDWDCLGFCYDSGHGNIGEGLKTLEKLKDRLISIHLHDNDGKNDQHKLLYSGTVDWDRLAHIIARSSYKKCVSMEVNIKNANISDETKFLSETYKTGLKFSQLVDKYSKIL